MTHASVARVLRQAAQGVRHYLAERLTIGSIYFALAAIVTVGAEMTLSSVSDRLQEARTTVWTAFASSSQAAPAFVAASIPATHFGPPVAMAIPAVASSNATGSLAPLRNNRAPQKAKRKLSLIADHELRALSGYISRKYKVAYDMTSVLVDTAHKVGSERRVDPLLLLAVMAVESRYDPFAQSPDGAQGLMQVMTRVHQDKFQSYGKKGPLDPVANINVGAAILKDCIAQRGSVNGGLACYVGASGPSDNGYGAKVQAERRQLALVLGTPVAMD